MRFFTCSSAASAQKTRASLALRSSYQAACVQAHIAQQAMLTSTSKCLLACQMPPVLFCS